MNYIIALIIELEPSFKTKILIEERLNNIDALIATGSDNTAKHFDYYFSSIPRIIRKNRVSVAVLTGEESKEELTALGMDMLTYYGLGCRNVSKLFIPKNMDLTKLFEAIEPLNKIINDAKYANNYEYNRSIYLLKTITHLDNGFIIATETTDLVSPIAVFYYERYTSIGEVKNTIQEQKDKLQCIVAKPGVIENSVDFGNTQCPLPWDYADGVDTLAFLEKL